MRIRATSISCAARQGSISRSSAHLRDGLARTAWMSRMNAGLCDVRTRTGPVRMCPSSARTEHCERAEAHSDQWGSDAGWVKQERELGCKWAAAKEMWRRTTESQRWPRMRVRRRRQSRARRVAKAEGSRRAESDCFIQHNNNDFRKTAERCLRMY